MTLKEVEKKTVDNLEQIAKNTTNISILMKVMYFVLAAIIGQIIHALVSR